MRKRTLIAIVLMAGLTPFGCGYKYYAGDLGPVTEQQQSGTRIEDDGSVIFTKDRLEIAIRAVTDAELNRQFAGMSTKGTESENPYTYGDWEDPKTGEKPSRFTVFFLKVKNYAYPKVFLDPSLIVLTSDNGREYRAMTIEDLDDYFLTYATGFAGNLYALYDARVDVLTRTLFKDEMIFSGREQEGYLVFPTLHWDVSKVRLQVPDVVLRYDFRDEPVETESLEYAFSREIGRFYPNEQGAVQ